MIKSQGVALAREHAESMDARDPLRGFRDRFAIDDQRIVYLDGNSLGRLPRGTLARLSTVAEREWGGRLIRAWEEGWMELPIEVGDRLGVELLGAAPGQVVVGDSTTVCFYKLVSAALDARPGRHRIVTDLDNFPTDRYVLEGLARSRGLIIDWLASDPSLGPTAAGLVPLVGPDTALVTFSHTSYRSAFIAEMAEINALAHEEGALTLWDLSHSAGSVPLSLDDDGADLATGCSYKYLNGGPGAPAFMYVRRELQGDLRQPIWGWLGRRDPFAMEQGYEAADGMRGFLSGTPPVLALAAVDEGVRLLAEAGIARIREKGIGLTEFTIALADARLSRCGVAVRSPREAERRGAHVALSHPGARSLCASLIERGVIVDFRRPDVLRLGCSPLSTRYVDVWDGVEALAELLD
ncbi:MAG: kynureninase [Solirubrobacterales bacterium]|nr:kynureninase [Solirubrobacterales bacterium]